MMIFQSSDVPTSIATCPECDGKIIAFRLDSDVTCYCAESPHAPSQTPEILSEWHHIESLVKDWLKKQELLTK